MKTRIVFTKIHEDSYFRSLSDREQCFFFFLLTNERVNLSGMYHCPDWYILGVKPHWNQKSLNEMKSEFQANGKFAFIDGWVKILNYSKYNQYTGESNLKALGRELQGIPESVLSYTPDTLPTGGVDCPDSLNNQKSVISNQKSDEVYKNIITHYNSTFEKQTKSYASWKPNCDFWLGSYTLEDIKTAITNWKKHGWWATDPSLDLLFRTKNKNGQPVDYIDQLLNLKGAIRDSQPVDSLTALMRRVHGQS